MFEPENPPPAVSQLSPRHDRIVRNTVLDLRQRRFTTSLNGFNRTEVLNFLANVADDYEQLVLQVDTMQQELRRLEALLFEHRLREDNLRNTLLTAQKLADDIREAAKHEAKILVREAEARASLLLEKAQGRLEEIEREINDLRVKRRNVEGTIEASITSLQHALEFVRAQDKRDRDERILLHRPRQADSAASGRSTGAPIDAPQRRAEGEY